MGIPKFMGIETEYNIYSSLTEGSTDQLINEMIGVLKGEQLGLDKRAVTPTRCFLKNGGLIYKDMSAPEYCTPECPDPQSLAIYDKAGEIIVQKLAEKVSVLSECEIAIHKKSSDGHGNTSGCHENYSISPELFKRLTANPVEDLIVRAWATFLAVRQLIVGGGKIGSEISGAPCPFQISQRADFIVAFRNNTTVSDRPVIQCRDEALADQKLVRRLHVVIGDANMCEWAIFLKGGLSALMLMALESDYFEARKPPIFKAFVPKIIRSISRDIDLQENYETESVNMPAISILRHYLETLTEFLSNDRPTYLSEELALIYFDVLEKAQFVLSRLEAKDHTALFGICDWTTKLMLAEKFSGKRSRNLQDCVSDSEFRLDLTSYIVMGYSSTDPAAGLYHALNKRGLIKRIATDEEIRLALENPPQGRATQRTAIIEKFNKNIEKIDWGKITISNLSGEYTIEFPTPFGYINEQVLKDELRRRGYATGTEKKEGI